MIRTKQMNSGNHQTIVFDDARGLSLKPWCLSLLHAFGYQGIICLDSLWWSCFGFGAIQTSMKLRHFFSTKLWFSDVLCFAICYALPLFCWTRLTVYWIGWPFAWSLKLRLLFRLPAWTNWRAIVQDILYIQPHLLGSHFAFGASEKKLSVFFFPKIHGKKGWNFSNFTMAALKLGLVTRLVKLVTSKQNELCGQFVAKLLRANLEPNVRIRPPFAHFWWTHRKKTLEVMLFQIEPWQPPAESIWICHLHLKNRWATRSPQTNSSNPSSSLKFQHVSTHHSHFDIGSHQFTQNLPSTTSFLAADSSFGRPTMAPALLDGRAKSGLGFWALEVTNWS